MSEEPKTRVFIIGDSITRFDEQRGCYVHEVIHYDAEGNIIERTITELRDDD